MLQINKNIKLIRELSGKKQEDFAKLIKTNLSNLKTYENSSVRPKANVIAAICDFAGITTEELENKALTHKDVHLEVDIVDKRKLNNSNGQPDLSTLLSQLMQKQNQLMEMQNKILSDTKQDLIEKVKEIHINSKDTISYLQTILRMTRADDGVIMDNQDVQAGREIGSSATYAGTLEIAAAMEQNKDKKKKGRVRR